MLEKVRDEINQIDQELAVLLEKRYKCVDEVVRIKKENQIPILDSNREELVLKRIANLIKEEKYKDSILETFQNMMDISKEYQSKL
ncbi:MAG: chorismate mutase [Vagococcus sp.]|uniref:chorismate mutase n=2 Tax=Vagococcus sp. TaxID=1933889 RepID=UPI002FC81E5E